MKNITRLFLFILLLTVAEPTVQRCLADDEVSDAASLSSAGVFGQSFLIILREGVEVILVLGAISAVVAKSGATEKLRVVRYGTMSGVAASVLTAAASLWFVRSISANKSAIEGVTMLLATAVLFFVGHWLIGRAESKHWVDFIKSKVKTSVGGGSVTALWLACFLAVYREGAETTLFYQGLISSDTGRGGLVLGGLIAGLVTLVALYFLLRRGILKIPTRPFFLITSAFLYCMAFIFAGRGIDELQEASWIGKHAFGGFSEIKFLGIFPTIETLAAQAILALAMGVSLVWIFRQRQPEQRIESSASPKPVNETAQAI